MRLFKVIFLSGIFFAHLMCGMLFFSTLRYGIRSTSSQRISESDKKDFLVFTLTPEEFKRHSEKDGEELIINNAFYDIKSIEQSNGKLVVTAIADCEETDLVKKFTALFHLQSENDSNRIQQFNFSYEYLFPVYQIVHSSFKEINFNLPHYRFHYYSFLFRLQLSPPPELS